MKYSILNCSLFLYSITGAYLLKLGTSQNDPKRAKTSQNDPIAPPPPPPTQKKTKTKTKIVKRPETTQNFETWKIWNFLLVFVF